MSRWTLSPVVLAVGFTCIAGADEIAFEKGQPKVTQDEKNPRAIVVAAAGTFTVSGGKEFVRVKLYARGPLTTKPDQQQQSSIEAEVDKGKGTWKATLHLIGDDHEVWAEVETRDKKTKLESATRTKPINTKPQKG